MVHRSKSTILTVHGRQQQTELVVEVDVNKANASIKSINTGLSSMEQTAANAARGAARGIDGMTASMMKGATDGNLFADAIKGALQWATKFWTLGAVQMAAHEARLEAFMKALAKAHGISEGAALAQAQAVRKIGFYGEEANRALKASLDDNRRQEALEADVEFEQDGQCYVRKPERDTNLVRYCPVCWGKDRRLVPLAPYQYPGTFRCAVHNSCYPTKAYEDWQAKQQPRPGNRIAGWFDQR